MSRTRSVNRKNLSQNFLVDSAITRRMLAVARPRGLVLEPGGGAGAMTKALVQHAHVWTYELDPHFAARLGDAVPQARVIAGDFVRARAPHREFQVVGNIPYSRTSAIVDWCLKAPGLRSATLLTQLEFALKRSGGYGRWSRLTCLTWPTHEWSFHGRVSRTAFRPVPRVDSGILHIVRREHTLLTPAERRTHAEIVRIAFLGVGGCVGASLSAHFGRERTGRALRAAAVPHRALVASVSPDSWLTVARSLSHPS